MVMDVGRREVDLRNKLSPGNPLVVKGAEAIVSVCPVGSGEPTSSPGTLAHLSASDQVPDGLPLRSADSYSNITPSERTWSSLSDPNIVRAICGVGIPGWHDYPMHQIRVDRLLTGLTNQLFRVSIAESDSDAREEGLRVSVALFRIYGDNIALFYDSPYELHVFKTLSLWGVASGCIAEFHGGRLEGWIQGRTITRLDMITPRYLPEICSLLAKFHVLGDDLDRPDVKDLYVRSTEYTPAALKIAQRWREGALEALKILPAMYPPPKSETPEAPMAKNYGLGTWHLYRRSTVTKIMLQTIDLWDAIFKEVMEAAVSRKNDAIRKFHARYPHLNLPVDQITNNQPNDLKTLLKLAKTVQADIQKNETTSLLDFLLNAEVPTSDNPDKWDDILFDLGIVIAMRVGFSHNDVQENNIMHITNNEIRLIDFEYSTYSFVIHDISSLWGEVAIDNNYHHDPCFKIYLDQYPSLEMKMRTMRTYLAHIVTSDPDLPPGTSSKETNQHTTQDTCPPPDRGVLSGMVGVCDMLKLRNDLQWGYWALVRAQVTDKDPWGFLAYGLERLLTVPALFPILCKQTPFSSIVKPHLQSLTQYLDHITHRVIPDILNNRTSQTT